MVVGHAWGGLLRRVYKADHSHWLIYHTEDDSRAKIDAEDVRLAVGDLR